MDQFNSVCTNAKAGMEMTDEDKARVKKTIYDLSVDSSHFKNEQRKKAAAEARISESKAKAANMAPSELIRQESVLMNRYNQMDAERELNHTWLVVDMDAFYAACEERHNPQLRGQPFAVGGLGMICTASYAARKFGVRSAMPGFIAKVLCPHLIFVAPNFERYHLASAETREIFKKFDPQLETSSLDEAYLDITDHLRSTGLTSAQVAEEIRMRVRDEVGLTCSCGIGPNMMIAKISADKNKPDGQYIVGSSSQEVMSFMRSLPVRKVPGIGQVAEMMLGSFGVKHCGDIASKLGVLSVVLTPSFLNHVMRASLGLGQTAHSPLVPENEPNRKGISSERTFTPPLTTKEDLIGVITNLVESLATDMEAEKIEGKNITLKIKTSTFELKTRSVTLPRFVSSSAEILPHTIKLLMAEFPVIARLTGVRISSLRKKGFAGPLDKWIEHGLKDVLPSAVGTKEEEVSEDEELELLLARPPDRPSPSTSRPNPPSSTATPNSWTCRACTFAGNNPLILRCQVCDSLKGLEHLTGQKHPRKPAGSKGKRPKPNPERSSCEAQLSIKDVFKRKAT